jgi:predicted ATPase/DNA-binding winged helix-turn-helix (wHTH) protein
MKYFAQFRFDDQHGLLWQSGLRVPLTAKAAAVLASLMAAPEQRLSLNEILRQVWPDTHVTSGNIKVLVREIRQALGDNVHTPRFVRTLPHGYELIPPVSNVPPRLGAHPEAVFVGRQRELYAITNVLADAENGARRTVLITGGPGAGKTALSEQAMRVAARHGFAILQSACLRSSGPPEPLSPILDAIHRALTDLPHLREVIAPHAPALLQHLSDADRARSAQRNQSSLFPRLVREIVAAVEELAKHSPTMFVLDDVQWLDEASVDVVEALARRHYDCRLVVLITSRPFTGSAAVLPLGRLAAELVATDVYTAFPLTPLGQSDIEEYALRRFGAQVAQTVGHLLFSASEGYPALLTASANALVRDGAIASSPGGWLVVGGTTDLAITVVNALEQVMERQLGELAPEERRLLASVSALGLEFSARKAARVSNQDPASVERMLDRLARQGEIIARREVPGRDGDAYQFTHVMYLEVLNGLAVTDAVA